MISILKSLTGRRKHTESTAIGNDNQPSKQVYRYTILSYLFDDYDKLHEVINPEPDVRYIMITDNSRLKSKTWEVHHFSEYASLTDIHDIIGRVYYIKYHPFEFCDTNVCFTIDASVCILKPLDKLYDDFLHSKSEYGLPIHPYLSNIYDELNYWRNARGLSVSEENAQKHLFGKTSFNKYVLFQTNMIMRKKGKVASAIDEMTWTFLKLTSIKGYVSRVDNTILTYVIATYMSNSKYFLFSQDMLMSSYLQWMTHNTNSPVVIDKRYRIKPSVFGNMINPYKIE